MVFKLGIFTEYLLTLGAHAQRGLCSCPVCVCVCVRACVCVCLSVCLSVRSFLPPCACRSQNIGTNRFTATQKKTFIIMFFGAKNASFRSYGLICLPRMQPTTLKPQKTDTKEISRSLERHWFHGFSPGI